MNSLPCSSSSSSPSSLYSDGVAQGRGVIRSRGLLLVHSGLCSWRFPPHQRLVATNASRGRDPSSLLSRRSSRSSSPVGRQFSEEEEEEDDEDDDDDDEEAAEEYVDGSPEMSEEEDGLEAAAADAVGVGDDGVRAYRFEEHKSQRVARLLAEVKEFGEEIIDYNELAGIYDFPLDKFQVRRIPFQYLYSQVAL